MLEEAQLVTWETTAGEPLVVGDRTLTPQSQALHIRWPGGGFVWNRPVSMRVEQDGRAETMPVRDTTRVVVWSLWAVAGLALLAAALVSVGQIFRR